MVVRSARPCVFIMLLNVSKAAWIVLTFLTYRASGWLDSATPKRPPASGQHCIRRDLSTSEQHTGSLLYLQGLPEAML